MHRTEFVTYERPWKLHVWTLMAPASTWNAQIEELYRQTNAFALIGESFAVLASIENSVITTKFLYSPYYRITTFRSPGRLYDPFLRRSRPGSQSPCLLPGDNRYPVHRVFQFCIHRAIWRSAVDNISAMVNPTQTRTHPTHSTIYQPSEPAPSSKPLILILRPVTFSLWPGAERNPGCPDTSGNANRSRVYFLPSRAIPSDRTHVDPRFERCGLSNHTKFR